MEDSERILKEAIFPQFIETIALIVNFANQEDYDLQEIEISQA